MSFYRWTSVCAGLWSRAVPRLRASLYFACTGVRFRRIGAHAKIRGAHRMQIGSRVALGDFCWIEAVERYGDGRFLPELSIGDDVAISDLTHISCVRRISIGAGCLLGSKIYIGDHSHGSTRNYAQMKHLAPAARPLDDAAEIVIGERVWIGDGAVILAGAQIAAGSILGANCVASLRVERPALIAGIPARVIRYLDDGEDILQGASSPGVTGSTTYADTGPVGPSCRTGSGITRSEV